jgi:hypothetical protein
MVRLDDGFHGDPKVVAAGNAAVGLYCRALTWSHCYQTDGILDLEAAGRIGGTSRDLCRLVEVGLLEDLGDGRYQIVGYLARYYSHAELVERRGRRRPEGRRP